MNREKLVILNAFEIFDEEIYVVPLYQREYAWENEEINQLLVDIDNNTENQDYYLGNIIVDKNDKGKFEVIDGQQRLTTLFILYQYLGILKNGKLEFTAREKYKKTLSNIENEENGVEELITGYKIIKSYFATKSKSKKEFLEKLKKVKIVRVQVPEKTDLNRYFEIMNTRGEQLELHEIAKARILKKLEEKDRVLGARIWEACEKMNTYVQMNFNKEIRDKFFGANWDSFKLHKWEDLKIELTIHKLKRENKKTLEGMITSLYREEIKQENLKEEGREPFESILSFPNFLLQVNAVVNGEKESLNDKNFIKIIEKNWETKEKAETFLVTLLKCRFYFDNYIIKRTSDENGDKEWSLKKLTTYQEKRNKTPNYNQNTMNTVEKNEQLKNLQACLRITYTSPSAMDWVTKVLRSLSRDKNSNLIELLETYCEEKVEKANYKTASGFNIERIVFSYLDYILYRDNILNSIGKYPYLKEEIKDWKFQFRDSIEHFYPQTQMGDGDLTKWEVDDLNDFGNLALITTQANSRFSNLPPETKIKQYGQIAKQSLKLTIMKKEMEENQNEWSKDLVKRNGKEMRKILEEDLKKQSKKA